MTQSKGQFEGHTPGEWVDFEVMAPACTDPINEIWIRYEWDGKEVIEIGYVCGENCIKGGQQFGIRYPPVTHWKPLIKPESPLTLVSELSSLRSQLSEAMKVLGKLVELKYKLRPKMPSSKTLSADMDAEDLAWSNARKLLKEIK